MRKRFVVLILFFAPFVAGALLLHSPSFHRALLKSLQERTGSEISFADSRLGLLRGRLTLRKPVMRIPRGSVRFVADRVFLNVSYLSLLRGKLVLKGLEVDRPVLTLAAEGRPKTGGSSPGLLWRSFFERFEGSVFLQNSGLERLSIQNLSVKRGEEGISVFSLDRTVLRIEPTYRREIEIEVQVENLKTEGETRRSFHLEGVAGKGGLRLKGDVVLPDLLTDTLGFELETTLDREVVSIDKIAARSGKGILEAKGALQMETGTYRLNFKARDVSLESIFQKLSGPVLSPASGIGEVEGEAIGRLPRLIVRSNAKIRQFRHTALFSREAFGTLNLDWPALEFDAKVRPGEEGKEPASVRGRVDFVHLPGLEKLQALVKTVDLKFEDASLKEILPSLAVSGRLNGDLHLEGIPLEGESPSVRGVGHARVTEGRLGETAVNSLETEVSFLPGGEIVFKGTEFQILPLSPIRWGDPLVLETSGSAISFKGDLATGLSFRGRYEKEGGSFESSFKGKMDLEKLVLFPSIFREGRGTAHLDLTVTGSLQSPLLKGKVEFFPADKAEIEFRGLAETFSNLSGILAIDGQTLRPKLTGQFGDGTFRLGGEIRLARWRPQEFDLTLHGTNLTLSRPRVWQVDLDADLSLKGPYPSPLLAGRIDLVDGSYTKDFIVRELVLRPFEEDSEPAPWEKVAEPVQLKLAVKNSGELRIKNNVAAILFKSDLKVGGSYGHPRLSGSLAATEGVLTYLGKNFLLNEGRLEFPQTVGEEPYLVLQAEQKIPPTWTVFVELKGPLSNLLVHLESSPSLPREDIQSLLATGLTQEEIRGGRSRRSLQAGILAEEISNVLQRPLTRSTGLDIFKLEASASGRLSVLSVGKSVTDRLSLEFRSDLAPETAERTIQANYYLTDNILLKGFRTGTGGPSPPRYQFNVSFRFRLN